MRAAQLVAPGRVVVDEFPVRAAGPGEVLLRSRGASICGSDLHTVFGEMGPESYPYRPGYPGHEGLGEVLESRSPLFKPGDLVLSVPDDDFSAAFADFQVVPDRSLVPLPTRFDLAQLLMAQQLGTVVYALKRFWPRRGGGTATVIGTGSAGLYFVQLLKQAGFDRLIASDLSPQRLAVAREMGADLTVLAPGEDVVAATLEATGGAGADLVVESAGHDATRAQAMEAVRVEGRVGLFGLPERRGLVPYPYEALFRRKPTIEISVGTQHEANLASCRQAVDMIVDGRVEVSRLMTHRFGIESVGEALEIARSRSDGAIKVSLTFE